MIQMGDVGSPLPPTPISNTEKLPSNRLKVLANGILCAGALTTGTLFVIQKDRVWWMLGLSVMSGAEINAFLRLNLSAQERRAGLFFLSRMIYLLFLPLWTIAKRNPESGVAQRLPLAALSLASTCDLEELAEGIEELSKNLKAADVDCRSLSSKRRFGAYPEVAEIRHYGVLMLAPLGVGSLLMGGMGLLEGTVPDFLLKTGSIFGPGFAVGGISALALIHLRDWSKTQDMAKGKPLSSITAASVVTLDMLKSFSQLSACLTYALILGLHADPKLLNLCGFLLAARLILVQERLELEGVNSASLLPSLKKVAYVAQGLFCGALILYTLIEVIEGKEPLGEGMALLGGTGGAFLLNALLQSFWREGASSSIWLARLFGSEWSDWLAILSALLVNVAQENETLTTLSLGMVGLTLGTDLGRLMDDKLLNKGVSIFGRLALMLFSVKLETLLPTKEK